MSSVQPRRRAIATHAASSGLWIARPVGPEDTLVFVEAIDGHAGVCAEPMHDFDETGVVSMDGELAISKVDVRGLRRLVEQ